jgi:uncharacterized membrane protein
MSGNSGDRGSAMARYRDWAQRLTLKQYALFMGVVTFVVATVIDAVTARIMEPFSWTWVIVWSAVMTAVFTAVRKVSLPDGSKVSPPDGSEYPAGQGDDPTRS